MLLRVWRMSTAASPVPSTKAGMIMRLTFPIGSSQSGTKPDAGSQPSRTEKNRISMIPSQKLGIDSPHRDTPLASRSQSVFRRVAEKTPAGIAMPTAISTDSHASSMVIGSFRATVFTTGSRVRMDSPRSPRSASPAQRRYWSTMGSLSPYFSRISSSPAGSASVPPITRAGSPGMRRTPVNTITLITNSVATEIAARWIRNSSTGRHRAAPGFAARGGLRASVPGRALEADQAVRDRLVALEALGKGRDVIRVVEVDDIPPLAGHLVDGFLVQRRPLRRVGDL